MSGLQENEIALMTDVESMFYQLGVLEEDRIFLKFLWKTDGKYQNLVIYCEMNVHVLVQHHHLGAVIMPRRKYHLVIKKFGKAKPQIHYVETFMLMIC